MGTLKYWKRIMRKKKMQHETAKMENAVCATAKSRCGTRSQGWKMRETTVQQEDLIRNQYL